MSLLITGNKSKIWANEIKSVNISSVIGLSTDFQTFIDPNQTSAISSLNNSVNTINNNINNLTNLLNNNTNNDNINFTNLNNNINNINNNINIINTWITNLNNNKSDMWFVNTQINNINNSINLINNDINDILTKNISYDNFINNDINNLLNEKVNIWTYNNDLLSINNNHNNQQTQINNINTTLGNLGGQDIATTAQIDTINTQINYLTPIVNTSQNKINLLETSTIPNINTWLTNLTNNKLNIWDFNNEKTSINNNIALKSNITDVYYKSVLYTKSETDALLNNTSTNLNNNYYTKTNIDNIIYTNGKEESSFFVDWTFGNDTNDGRTLNSKYKNLNIALDNVNPWGSIFIRGWATYNLNNYSLNSSKTSLKIVLSEGVKITGTLNLVEGNTAIQFFGGKIWATINDNSSGTLYFKNVDLSSSIINLKQGYKVFENSQFSPSLINCLSTSTASTIIIKNIDSVPINLNMGWTCYKLNSTLILNTLWVSANIIDLNFLSVNKIITQQATLNVLMSWGWNGLYVVNFSNPSHATLPNLWNGDIIYRVSPNNFIINKFVHAPPSIYNYEDNCTYTKSNFNYIKSISSYSKDETYWKIETDNIINNVNSLISFRVHVNDYENDKIIINNNINNRLLISDFNNDKTLINDNINTRVLYWDYLFNKNLTDENINILNNDKLNISTYNTDKNNIDNSINNLWLLKADISYINNEFIKYPTKSFLNSNHYNKTETDELLNSKTDINYVMNSILEAIQNLQLTDIFNLQQLYWNINTDYNNFKNIWYQTTTDTINWQITNLENLTTNQANDILALENYNITNTLNINNINNSITTLQNFNNTNGNINLWRINLTGWAENKILKVVGGVLNWADDNSGTNGLTSVAFWDITRQDIATYTFLNSNNSKIIEFNNPATVDTSLINFYLTHNNNRWSSFNIVYDPRYVTTSFFINSIKIIDFKGGSANHVIQKNIQTSFFQDYTLGSFNSYNFINFETYKRAGTYINNNTIPISKLQTIGAITGQVIKFNGSAIVWSDDLNNDLTNYYNKNESNSLLNNKLNISDFTNIPYSKLNLLDNDIPLNKLNKTTATTNQILKFDGTNIIWSDSSSGGGLTNNSILTNHLQTDIIPSGDNPWLNMLFYNYNNNKFIKSEDIGNTANFKINFNTGSQSFLHFIPNMYGTNTNYSIGSMYMSSTNQLRGGIALGSDKTWICLNRLWPVMIFWDNGSQICEFYLGGSNVDITSSWYLKSRISSTGSYSVMSWELRKYNIEEKTNNNILNRILNLKIYSYVLNDVCDQRVIGLVINKYLYENFKNIIINSIPRDTITTRNIKEKYEDLTKEEKLNLSVDYNILLCYLLMAFQDFVKNIYNVAYEKQKIINLDLINKIEEIENIILNKKLNKNDWYKNLLSENIDNSILFLQNENTELKRKNEILNNRINTLETKYNNLWTDYINICKSYDDLFIKIQLLEDKFNNNNKMWVSSSTLKKSTTLKK